MMVLAWAAGLLLATHFFGQWQDAREMPNPAPVSLHANGYIEVRLLGDPLGHFRARGSINGTPVVFLLDTGATDVAVPESLVEALNLPRGAAMELHTANGRATGYRTHLARLQLGDIVLTDVRALIAPGMGNDQVLLGMSALRQLEFTQRDGTLVLRQYTSEAP
jgi:aspartyl protease family protein